MESLPDVISSLPIGVQYLIAGLVVLATIGIPVSVLIRWIARWPMFKLWPHREGWVADCPRDNKNCYDPNIGWNKKLGARWTQARKMLMNDFYSLDIRKPRVISRIRLITDGPRYPKKSLLQIREERSGKWGKIGEFEQLDAKFDSPRKMTAFKFSIIEPREEVYEDSKHYPAWSIYDVELTEVRLFRRWWHKVIEEQI